MLPEWDAEATDTPTLKVLAAFIRLLCPQVVVEAGTYRGHGAIHMARALKKNGEGVLVTADPYDHGQEEALEGFDNVWVYTGDYADMLDEVGGDVDFAFIDASEWDAEGARLRWRHFEATRKRLSPGGLICVHDTAADDWMDGEGGASVYRIREACQLNLIAGRGLSIYHRP